MRRVRRRVLLLLRHHGDLPAGRVVEDGACELRRAVQQRGDDDLSVVCRRGDGARVAGILVVLLVLLLFDVVQVVTVGGDGGAGGAGQRRRGQRGQQGHGGVGVWKNNANNKQLLLRKRIFSLFLPSSVLLLCALAKSLSSLVGLQAVVFQCVLSPEALM